MTTDVPDANAAASRNPKTARFQVAAKQGQLLKATEAKVLATSSPPIQQQYLRVSAALAQQPVAQLALQQLLFEGTLQAKDSKGGTLLATLDALASSRTPLAAGLNRSTLVAELAQELAQPSSIDQAQRNTCGPTTVSVFLASTRPAEYARLIAGLASPAGKAEMISGSLSRVEGTTTDDKSGRTSTQRLLEPALLDFADGTVLRYDNAADKHSILGLPTVPGALPSMVASMLTALMGRQAQSAGSLLGKPDAASVVALERSAKASVPVPTMIDYGEAGEHFGLHWVLTTRIDAKQVTIVNPWGREETLPRAEFDRRLKGLALPG